MFAWPILALHTREVVPGRTGNKQHPILHFDKADNFAIAYYAGGEAEPKALPFTQEPQIEPEPGVWTRIDQRGQVVHGPQTVIAGDAHGPVLSGKIDGPVSVGGGDAVDMRGSREGTYFNQKGQKVEKQTNIGTMSGGFFQPNMRVGGNVHQAERDIVMGDRLRAGRDIHKSDLELKSLFEDVLEMVTPLPDEQQRVVKPVVESVRDQVNEIQQSGIEDETSPKYTALNKSLKTLVDWVPDIADVVLGFLQNPATGIISGVRKLAERLKAKMEG